MYSPKSIANYFIDQSLANDGVGISPMKLQKLVYYAHGWYAGHTSTPLINETVEAWQYGPVISSLYHEFKQFGAGKINRHATDFEGLKLVTVPTPTDPTLINFLQNVWANYSKFTSVRLSQMTHAPDGPWDKTWKTSGGVKGADIPFDLITAHFKAAIDRSKDKGQQ